MSDGKARPRADPLHRDRPYLLSLCLRTRPTPATGWQHQQTEERISALIHASFLLRDEPLWVYLSFAFVAVAYPAGVVGLYWQRVPVGLRKFARASC
ncbi:MAG: hypothetical protein ACR2HR_15740 [Euzebya sp.]